MSAFSGSSSLQRGVGTPPPSRPRLFTRTSADRKSPPPPARLAPITPAISPEAAPHLCAEENQHCPPCAAHDGLTSQKAHAHRRHLHDEEEAAAAAATATVAAPSSSQHTTARAATWCAASTPPLHAIGSSPQREHNRHAAPSVRTSSSQRQHQRSEAAAANSAPPSARVEPLLQQSKVMLTPPRTGSGGTANASGIPAVVRDGSAGAGNPDWTGHGRVESMMLTTKRERLISSADTQHSMASSSTPPPHCKRAVNDDGTCRTQTRAAAHHPTATPEDVAGCGSGAKALDQPERLRLSTSTSRSRSSSSRGAISDSSSSDLVATAAAAVLTMSTAGVAESPAAATTRDSADASAQCLVLDDSVDRNAVVSPDQLQRLIEEAADTADPPTPYRRRLITAEVLRDWTGWEDLELVLATQLRVDAEAMIGVDQISRHLPRLSSLKLHGSRIPRLRQLGTGFHALKFLWLNSCHLTDLRGLAACCPALVELYVSFNYLADVTPVMELSSTLEVLDLEGNSLDDPGSLGFVLASLQKVTALSLQGNPLTCEHQDRVREACAALTADEDPQKADEKKNDSTGAGCAVASTETQHFTDVLCAWVRCLMPNLQTLDDAPMRLADATALQRSPTAHVLSAPAVHVDPLRDRLAEELRLVEAYVRETDPFDPLREAVEEANQQAYTRPSTSCSGARPRLTPATAMGISRGSTSARSGSAATSHRLGSGSPVATAVTNASVLTTGAVLAGNATTSLRRRLATPTPTPLTSSLEDATAGVNEDGAAVDTTRTTSTRLQKAAAAASTAEDEDARVAALLADNSEEDEWEHYKSSLLLSSSNAITDDPATKRASFSAAAHLSADPAPSGAALPPMEDGFDKELKNEWSRLRLRMAKAGREA